MAVTFQQALDGAMKNYKPEEWQILSSSEQTAAIYCEMRRMDVEAAQLIQERAENLQRSASGGG